MMLINEKLLSPISSLNSASLSSNSASATSSCTSSVSDSSSSPVNSSGESSNQSSGRNSHFLDDVKMSNNLNQQLIDNFDLDKYLNESDEDLLTNKNEDSTKNQMNLFDLYPRMENDDLIDEETVLESVWPEMAIGRKLLLEFDQFKLNLSLPQVPNELLKTNGSFRINPNSSFINPEIFFLIFSIHDARNSQKISENFYHIPNYDLFFNQLTGEQSFNHSNRNSTCNLKSKHSIFSLDGKQIFDDIQSNSYLTKMNFLNKIKKVNFNFKLQINKKKVFKCLK